MKLLIIFPTTERGGMEEYALRIASAARKEGWDVHAAFPTVRGMASVIKDFTAKGIHYRHLDIAKVDSSIFYLVRQHLPQFLRTLTLLRRVKPDVVYVILPWPVLCFGSMLACAILQVPTAVRFSLITSRFSLTRTKQKVYAWIRAQKQQWLTVSENNRQLICDSFQIPRNEVIRIYNGTQAIPEVTIDNACPERLRLRRHLRRELKVSETSRIILTVGRLSAQKGYSDLLPIIPSIVQEFSDTRFVWVGDGEQRDSLASKMRERGLEDKVIFLGYRSDVSRLLLSADLFLFPTLFEGHSTALNEAMAHGLPIVASDASSIPEMVTHKRHGLLFHTGDTSALLETLRWALRHPQEMNAMARKAWLRIQNFPEEKTREETLELLRKLATTRPTPVANGPNGALSHS